MHSVGLLPRTGAHQSPSAFLPASAAVFTVTATTAATPTPATSPWGATATSSVRPSAEACAFLPTTSAAVRTVTATIATDSPSAMNPTRFIQYLFSATLLCSMPPQCVAQAPSGLSLAPYAGLFITGSVGTVY